MPGAAPHWDIFCAVVDNYGDAGIAWRLARTLVREHGLDMRLYIDALPALARLAPAIDVAREAQAVDGIEVRVWRGPQGPFAESNPGDVVIEAFGCGLPAAYLDAMAARPSKPVWINLEYLSAERWIEDCHGLASRHPTRPLTRYFFFPGFAPMTGGLLRERDLLVRRDRFRDNVAVREAFWRRLGIAPARNGRVVSLFCYPDAPVEALFDAWAAGDQPVLCLVPEGVARASMERRSARLSGPRAHGRLTLAPIPFLTQEDYDRLLWTCDINFVRGEDSFVRAQWAARPLVWNVYPQSDAAHLLKLEAFLGRYVEGLATGAASAYASFSRAWNGGADALWSTLDTALPDLARHAPIWAGALARQSDLASALVDFCRNRL